MDALARSIPEMEDELRMNADADYAGAVVRGQHMKLGFLKHNLMISRMHFMLEMASRSTETPVELAAWRQGAELRGNKVNVPEIHIHGVSDGTNEYTVGRIAMNDPTYPLSPTRCSAFASRGKRAEEQLASLLL